VELTDLIEIITIGFSAVIITIVVVSYLSYKTKKKKTKLKISSTKTSGGVVKQKPIQGQYKTSSKKAGQHPPTLNKKNSTDIQRMKIIN
jgi:hypothetical protein